MKYKAFSVNSEFFDSLLEDLEKAKNRIYIETFIFRNDKLGEKVKKILTEKAKKGVAVKLLIDAIGGWEISELDFYDFISAGGDVRFFRRLLMFPVHLAKLNNRTHRKLVMIDNRISYIGSTNIDIATSPWREFNLRIDDKNFNEKFSEIFIQQFVISNSLTLDATQAKKPYKIEETEILRSVPFVFHSVRKAFLEMVLEAKKEIVLENPYVVFDKKFGKSLKNAIGRGVKVTIIVPTRSDVNLMNYVNSKHLVKAKKMGAKIYFYPGMLHSKIIWIDREKWMFGSANLDYRSMFMHFEIMLKGKNGEVNELITKHVEKSLDDAIRHGKEFNGKISLKERVLGNLLYPIRFIF